MKIGWDIKGIVHPKMKFSTHPHATVLWAKILHQTFRLHKEEEEDDDDDDDDDDHPLSAL